MSEEEVSLRRSNMSRSVSSPPPKGQLEGGREGASKREREREREREKKKEETCLLEQEVSLCHSNIVVLVLTLKKVSWSLVED